MDFRQFEDHFRNTLVVNRNTIGLIEPRFHWNRLSEWQKAGYLHKINQGYYILDIHSHNMHELHLYSIAKEIYAHSYISLESALSYYHLIPDAVFAVTSVTTRRTIKHQTPFGLFIYRSLKPTMFVGYEPLDINGFTYFMAKKEKAIIDYLYLHHELKTPGDMHEIRINTEELFSNFNEELYWTFVRITQNKQLEKRAKVFLDYWRNPTYAHY